MATKEKRNLVGKFAGILNWISAKKIKDFFESVGCEPLVILKTPRAGQIVDNMYGIEFPLSDYAVIYKGNLYDNNYCKIFDFERKEGTDMLFFDDRGCKNGVQAFQALVNELKERDAYEVVYQTNEN